MGSLHPRAIAAHSSTEGDETKSEESEDETELKGVPASCQLIKKVSTLNVLLHLNIYCTLSCPISI